MRICHVIPSLRATMGGIPVTMVGLARGLGAAGFDQRILTTGVGGQAKELRPTSDVGTPIPIERLRVWGPPQYGITTELSRIAATVRWADAVSVHGIWSALGLMAMRAAKRAHVPYVVHAYGMLDPRALSRSAGRKRLAGQVAFFPALRDAAAIVYACDQERRDAESTIGKLPPGVVVPYTVDPPAGPAPSVDVAAFRAAIGGRDAAPRMLFLGRLDGKKRPDLAIEAVASLTRAGRPVRLVLVGEGQAEYVESLRSRAAQLGVTDRVHFHGPLYGPAKWAAFAASDAFVLPSEQESLAIAVLEAAASGLPIVTTPYVAGWEEVAAIGRVRTTDTNVDSVAAGWTALIDHLSEEKSLAAAGAPEVRRAYSTARCTALLAALYEQTLQAKGP
jgi:glycosyltransferase involved in cell wall biosynthesis